MGAPNFSKLQENKCVRPLKGWALLLYGDMLVFLLEVSIDLNVMHYLNQVVFEQQCLSN